MARGLQGLERKLGLLVIVLATLACNLQFGAPAQVSPTSAQPPSAAPTSTSEISLTATLTATSEPTSTATSTVGPPPVVTVSAFGGRLNVRRGPGPEYDTVGAFLDGQSTLATARNADGTWLLINIPNTTRSLGWITAQTKYTTVNGNASALPLVTVEPAVPAYIRNCTPHEMLIDPIGAILLDRSSAPENQLQFFPGEYTVFDNETEDELGSVTVFEGRTVDIKKDSSGKSFTCP